MRRSQTWSAHEDRTAMINNNNNSKIHQSSLQWNTGYVVVTKHRDKWCRHITSGKGASARHNKQIKHLESVLNQSCFYSRILVVWIKCWTNWLGLLFTPARIGHWKNKVNLSTTPSQMVIPFFHEIHRQSPIFSSVTKKLF